MTSKTDAAATLEPQKIATEGRSWKRSFQELGAAAVQNFDPVKQLDVHLCGFAYYKDFPNRQVQLHHFCHSINDDLIQCAVYDGDKKDSRLIGVEYVISRRLFDTLPQEEQKMWHSHSYDVKSGSFYAPGLPSAMEVPLMNELADTYGKTWIFWQTDRGDALPIGEPKLMLVATKDGQWQESLFQQRANADEIRKSREKMEMPPVHPNADWGAHMPETKSA